MSMIVLIGVTGSGKTTVGRLLSQRYALPLYEVDDAVEESLGAPMRTLVVGRVDGRYGFGAFPISLFVDAGHVNVTVFEPGDAGKLIAECGCARRGEVKLAVFPLYK